MVPSACDAQAPVVSWQVRITGSCRVAPIHNLFIATAKRITLYHLFITIIRKIVSISWEESVLETVLCYTVSLQPLLCEAVFEMKFSLRVRVFQEFPAIPLCQISFFPLCFVVCLVFVFRLSFLVVHSLCGGVICLCSCTAGITVVMA